MSAWPFPNPLDRRGEPIGDLQNRNRTGKPIMPGSAFRFQRCAKLNFQKMFRLPRNRGFAGRRP
jgi:hypothetical protein